MGASRYRFAYGMCVAQKHMLREDFWVACFVLFCWLEYFVHLMPASRAVFVFIQAMY
jgi:hypothetical protein